MGALSGKDEPQFEELTEAERKELAAEYERVWGEPMPTPAQPNPE
jgi:hypothetical protein